MNFYYAPMEGITLYPLRNIHRKVFGEGVDRYYTPFLTASHTHHFKNREKKDVLPDRNISFDNYEEEIVPQIMAANAGNFLWAAQEMKKLGYKRVNLNLGCPAPTVVNRHKGAGLLCDTPYLDAMLDGIFNEAEGKDIYPEISLKTRLGFTNPSEAEELMRIYASYPLKELIIHARVREDYYSGSPRLEDFKRAVATYRKCGGGADICYNGDVTSAKSFVYIFKELCTGADKASETDGSKTCGITSVMIGRGLLSDPSLVRQLKGGEALSAEELRTYLKCLYEDYAQFIPEDRNVIFKLLEHWTFLYRHFASCDRHLKAIRKSRSRAEYHAAVNNIFAECEFVPVTDSSC
jgi:tRNA-dihydrouridine synthase